MPPETTESNAVDERPVVGRFSVDVVVSLLILAFAVLLAWDSRRTGNSWAPDGPEAGYFPFYLSLLMGAASLFGLASAFVSRHGTRQAFVNRDQFGRVIQVAVPTLAFCILTQFLGLYVASFLLIAGFMRWIGRISAWISLVTALVFTLAMFVTFEVAFNVIMPKGPLEAALGY